MEREMKRELWSIIIGVLVLVALGYGDTIIPGGNVSGTWNAAGSPYLIEELINIPTNDTLFIQPGVDVIFQGQYMFEVRGSLIAEGSESDSIRITAADTSTGWRGLRLYNSRTCILSYCIVEYGNSFGLGIEHIGGGLYSDSGDPLITNCRFTRNRAETGGAMAFMWYSQPVIQNTLIDNNWSEWGGGIFADEYSYVQVLNCTVTGNTGVYLGGGIRGYYTAIYSIVNTIVEGNYGEGGINLSGVLDDTIRYCNVYNNENGNIVGAVPVGALEPVMINYNGDSCDVYYNISMDPEYYSTSGDSAYFLVEISPCIDAGDPLSPYDPDGTIADMGFFYYHQTQTIILGGDISGTWTAEGSPYIVTGDIEVQTGDSLIIEPGVEVRFNENTGVIVNGSLNAEGTVSDSILFTSSQPNPQLGDWTGIQINGSAELIFCSIEYGNHFSDWGSGLTSLIDCRVSLPYIGEPGPLNFIRSLVTVNVSLTNASPWMIEDCIFTGNLNPSYACNSVTINSTQIMGSLVYSSLYGDIQVTGCDIFENANMQSGEGHFYLTESTVHGSMHCIGDMTIDESTVFGDILCEDPNVEGIRLSTTSAVFHGLITLDFVYFDATSCLFNNTIEFHQAKGTQIHECTINGLLVGSFTGLGGFLDLYHNQIINGGIEILPYHAGLSYFIGQNQFLNSPENAIKWCENMGSGSLQVWNNTIDGAGGHGIAIWDSSIYGLPTINVRNNIITGCNGYGIEFIDVTSANVNFNNLWNNILGNYSGVSPGIGSISTDPYFVDPISGDYHLQSNTGSYHNGAWTPDPNHSPCIDAGDPASPFNNEPEPNGGIINMGAYGNTAEASKSFVPNYPDVTIELTYISGSPVPQGGGDLVYDIYVANNDSIPVNYDAWIEIAYEGGDPQTMILRHFDLYQPGWTINRPDTDFPIPRLYPAGNYTFTGKVGEHPDIAWDSSGFPFIKEGQNNVVAFNPTIPDVEFPDPFSLDGLIEGEVNIPETFILEAYPNPFNPTTTIEFHLPDAAKVKLTMFDVAGRTVATLVDGWHEAGVYKELFDASRLASGIYYARLDAGEFHTIRKMVLMK